jgi:hypothetical protein
MKDASPRPIALESSQLQFLEDAAKKFGLPDMGKAVRCLVNYAREHPDKHAEIFDEIRCTDC